MNGYESLTEGILVSVCLYVVKLQRNPTGRYCELFMDSGCMQVGV